MDREQRNLYTANGNAYHRAGGRRRYNAMRRRRADRRRAEIGAWLAGNPAALFCRGLSVALAAAFVLHRTTAWRDLECILRGGLTVNYLCGDELLYSV